VPLLLVASIFVLVYVFVFVFFSCVRVCICVRFGGCIKRVSGSVVISVCVGVGEGAAAVGPCFTFDNGWWYWG